MMKPNRLWLTLKVLRLLMSVRLFFEGSTVKLAFYQKPYILKDGFTYGTSLKLVGVQVATVNSKAGVDTGDMSPENVAELFGKTEGFKVGDPKSLQKAWK